jgi:membrane protease YdiL (CAAX protease family)
MAQATPKSSFRFKLLPLAVVAALGVGIPNLAAYLAFWSSNIFHTPSPRGPVLPWLYIQHAMQLAVALAAIAIAKRLVPADYGLHCPRAKTYIPQSVYWGVLFGVIMTVVDYAPQLLGNGKPELSYALTPASVGGWLFFEGIYVGPTEEIPFRGLLVTYLATTMPGRLRLGRFEMNWAGVVVALIFALLHATNFKLRAWPIALGQQIYAFALGILYAYWLEKSKSIIAPIVGHNVSDVVEYVLLFVWVGYL